VRQATIQVGIWLTLLVTAGAQAYALATWEQPNRGLISASFLIALSSALLVSRLPTDRIICSRWREPFFLAWSAADIALIAVITAADGGTHSPYAFLFVLPFIFGALSYPPGVTVIVGVLDIAAFAVVAVMGGGGPLHDGFVAFALLCAALLSSWEAHNQVVIRRALTETADALQESEETSRLASRQQEEVARFGQLALASATIEELLEVAAQTLERVLDVDIAAVLKLIPDEEELLVAAAAGLPEEMVGKARIPGGLESQSGYTLATGTPVIVSDWSTEDRFGQSEMLGSRGMVSGVTVMIRAKGQPYGVLGAQSSVRREFTGQDVSFLEATANIIANAVERRAEEDKTRYLALHDPLTGLPNRNLFLDRLGHALAQSRRRKTSVAVLFLDLDQFKLVNDSLGHVAGDELLAAIAPRLEQALRPGDTVARFGGDEFSVLAEDIHGERDAIKLAERIWTALARPFVLRRREHYVSASIGIAIGSGNEPPDTLLRDADSALYRAKDKGRGGYEIFDEVMRARVIEHVRTENDLRRALERGEFELHFQPVVSLADGSIIALEALLRWRHPERGLLGPAAFIPVAEESHLILPIGRWVIEQACRQAAAWQSLQPDGRPVGISINLSPRQIADPELARLVGGTLEASCIDPRTVTLELTESIVLEDGAHSERTLETLKRQGVRLALDDFGIGFSSLGYLRRLPLDAIKLDRSFIENVAHGSDDAAIVRTVVELAAALGIEVIAEGVETAGQLEMLRGLGCGFAQGFYFTRPVPSEQVREMLAAPPWLRTEPAVDGDGAAGDRWIERIAR